MIARVRAFSPDGAILLGVLPVIGLQFSVEAGGAGSCTFQAFASDLDALHARDSLIKVELQTAPGVWTAVAAYTLRPPFRRTRVGKLEVECTATAVLEQWASECVIFPEYAADVMLKGAGTDRAIGWQSTAYNPEADPLEAWAGCYTTSRTTMPSQSAETGAAWPTGSGAEWISITGASDEAERKLFRTSHYSPLYVATAGPRRVFIASDSPGMLYIAGEPVLEVSGGEPGRQPIIFQQRDMWLEPGQYACAFDTDSIWDTGGDGVDPVIIAICTLDANGEPDVWEKVSNDVDWVACRRDADPPDNDPPGPTPGGILELLLAEAQDRGVSGWPVVDYDFAEATDSYDAAWVKPVIERQVRYGSDTLWSVFQMLAETDECDVWMTPDLVLHAANAQGADLTATVTLDEADITTMSDTRQADEGTYAMALALDGWTDALDGYPRREYGMEVGTAITSAVALRVVSSALAENGRWDGAARLAPAAPTPLVDFHPGDLISLDYRDAPTQVRVLSVSAEDGDGGLVWDLELVEVATP